MAKLRDVVKLPEKDVETARDTAGIIENCQQVRNNLIDEIGNIDIPEPLERLDEEKVAEILYDKDHPNSTLKWKDLKYNLREKYIWRARAICQKFGKPKVDVGKMLGICGGYLQTIVSHGEHQMILKENIPDLVKDIAEAI